jgi:UPF0176 protein
MHNKTFMKNFTVAAFYKFTDLTDPPTLKALLDEICNALNICGTILIAPEGINGTIAGERASIQKIIQLLREQAGMKDLQYKNSHCIEQPFHRMKVRLKKEIVALGLPETKPSQKTGVQVPPKEWNDLILDPNVIVVDARNEYEVDIGKFSQAINPKTTSFREFPEYAKKNLKDKNSRIAMYCTGGIRCEKATAYLIDQGYEDLYQLQGGILKYLEEIPKPESLWEGECFVFDDRVSVDHNLKKGHYDLCHACRHPITMEEKQSSQFKQGISCPYCFGKLSQRKLAGLNERQKQVELAKKRGEKHVGKSFCILK